MTFGEILDVLFLDCDEDITDVEMMNKFKNFINRGYRELARREQLEKVVYKEVVDGCVYLPYDCVSLTDVKDSYGYVNYSVEGKKIVIEDSEDSVVRIIYNYLPEKLEAEEDELETLDSNSEFIINYAKWLYYVNDSLMEEAAMFKNELENIQISQSRAETNTLVNSYEGVF